MERGAIDFLFLFRHYSTYTRACFPILNIFCKGERDLKRGLKSGFPLIWNRPEYWLVVLWQKKTKIALRESISYDGFLNYRAKMFFSWKYAKVHVGGAWKSQKCVKGSQGVREGGRSQRGPFFLSLVLFLHRGENAAAQRERGGRRRRRREVVWRMVQRAKKKRKKERKESSFALKKWKTYSRYKSTFYRGSSD